MSLRAISPNQFAFPGMEEGAHPGAQFLPHGVVFRMEHEKDEEGVYSHSLTAHDPDAPHQAHRLGWSAARERMPAGRYPGEISWVGRSGSKKSAGLNQRGIMAAMYHMGHTLDMGQTTVPVHSPDRTPEGERWSMSVGPAHLRPRLNDWNWTPPVGIHPFQQNAEPPKRRTAPYAQGTLFPYREGEPEPDRSQWQNKT